METFERVAWLKGHKKRIEQVEFSPDGELIATTSGDGAAKIWDAKTGQ
ncbi:MAG: hypothetical protein JNJ50_14550 [Acidobacteria bacterium]|nr:hypothetical protein [Acidobacteriota bacterium]